MRLQIYFHDSPSDWIFDSVLNMCTEGNLLRLTFGNNKENPNQWFPLSNVFRIVELKSID